jgi:phosphoglycolate phosphatase
MPIETVIFDLDGTLVDSASAILESFAAAFRALSLEPLVPLTSSIIGPPLQQTLEKLSGTHNQEIVQNLSEVFKSHYDTVGYKETRAFEGIEALLSSVNNAGLAVFVATNKRHKPTRQIIDLLRWGGYFKAVYSLDTVQPTAQTKAELITCLVRDFNLNPAMTLYVGDRDEDGVAAEHAGVAFLQASWGYGSTTNALSFKSVGTVDALTQYLESVVSQRSHIRTS